jgi:hypothetical protein
LWIAAGSIKASNFFAKSPEVCGNCCGNKSLDVEPGLESLAINKDVELEALM